MNKLINPGGAGESWKLRAIRATKGNQSRLGCLLIAILLRTPVNPPRIRGTAVISADGIVIADMQLAGQAPFWYATKLGGIDEMISNFRGLADHLKLTDTEREEMFTLFRQWISKDFRATSDLDKVQ